VLVLRAHYTMDVFTGLVMGLYAAHLAARFTRYSAPWLAEFVPYFCFFFAFAPGRSW